MREVWRPLDNFNNAFDKSTYENPALLIRGLEFNLRLDSLVQFCYTLFLTHRKCVVGERTVQS